MNIQKAFFLSVLYYLSIELIGFWILLVPLEMQTEGLLKGYFLINASIYLIVLLAVFKMLKQSNLLRFKKANPKYYLIALILGIGFVFFQPILNLLYHQKIAFNYDFTLERLAFVSVLASALIIPITEELFFRSYMLRGLLKNYSPLVSIIISSVLFAFIHIPFMSLFFEYMDFSVHQAYIALFGGIISGILFYKSRSIIPSIIFHAFWNFTCYVL